MYDELQLRSWVVLARGPLAAKAHKPPAQAASAIPPYCHAKFCMYTISSIYSTARTGTHGHAHPALHSKRV